MTNILERFDAAQFAPSHSMAGKQEYGGKPVPPRTDQ